MNWINFIITPFVAAAVGFAVWYFQTRIEEIRRTQDRLNDNQRTVYFEVLEPFIRTFAGVNNPKETQKALKQVLSVDYRKTAFEFSLIGSDDVVRAFNSMMQHIYSMEHNPERQSTILMRLWGELLLAIRKDVGNFKTRLTAKDMLRNQIKDIDEYFDSQSE